jgi:hypothetical protein
MEWTRHKNYKSKLRREHCSIWSINLTIFTSWTQEWATSCIVFKTLHGVRFPQHPCLQVPICSVASSSLPHALGRFSRADSQHHILDCRYPISCLTWLPSTTLTRLTRSLVPVLGRLPLLAAMFMVRIDKNDDQHKKSYRVFHHPANHK